MSEKARSLSAEQKQELLDQVTARRELVDRIIRKHPTADPDNVWHTLVLLEQAPWERLKRSLIRGRTISTDKSRNDFS